MKTYIKLSVVAILLVTAAASCSKKKSGIPVPADAAFVLHIDGKSIGSKLSWEEVKKGEWFKTAMEEADDATAKAILNDPDESGLDLNSDSYFFVAPRGRGGYTGFVTNLKDVKKFEALAAQMAEGAAIKKDGDISILPNDDDNAVVTWKGNRLVFIADNPEMSSNAAFGEGRGRSIAIDSLADIAKEIHGLSGKKSLGNNSKFASLLDNKGDMHFWANGSAFGAGSLPGPLAMTNMTLLFEDNISTGTLTFDNGKITVKGKSYYNKDLAAIYKKYPMKNLDEGMLKKIPGNAAAVLALNYPPEGLQEFIRVLGVDGLLNIFLSQAGFSIGDFVAANKGDILLAVSDFTVAEREVTIPMGEGEPYVYKDTKPDAKFLFATSVNDKAAFEKFMGVLRQQIDKNGEGASDAISNMVPYQLKDNWFVAGNDSSAVNNFFTSNANHPFISKIAGHPAGGYIDVQKFLSGSRSAAGQDSTSQAMLNEAVKYWQDIVFYGGEFKNDATETYAEINMVDKNTNSLKQLNSFFSFMANTMINQRKKMMMYDEEVEMPPPAMEDSPVVKPAQK